VRRPSFDLQPLKVGGRFGERLRARLEAFGGHQGAVVIPLELDAGARPAL
jgi:hypothetical protein